MIFPSVVSRAAPTLNFEKGAWARSRAARAAAMSSSDIVAALRLVAEELMASAEQNPGNRRVDECGHKANEQGPDAQPGQVLPPPRCHAADATQLYADGRKIGETG